jgi:hypothetical protein
MSTPTSAMIYLCRDPADAGDLIQPVGRHLERGDLGLDLAVEDGDVGAGLIDAATLSASKQVARSPGRNGGADDVRLWARGLPADAGSHSITDQVSARRVMASTVSAYWREIGPVRSSQR